MMEAGTERSITFKEKHLTGIVSKILCAPIEENNVYMYVSSIGSCLYEVASRLQLISLIQAVVSDSESLLPLARRSLGAYPK